MTGTRYDLVASERKGSAGREFLIKRRRKTLTIPRSENGIIARFRYCRQEMRTAPSCSPRSRGYPRITIEGQVFEPVRFCVNLCP